MDRTFISLALNFFFLPMGYLYLKESRRFVAGMFYALLGPAFFSFVAWVLPVFFPAWLTAPFLICLSLLILTLILIDTYLLSKHNDAGPSWPVFSRPHTFWFIPLYWIAFFTIGVITEPWEKPFAKTHNIPSPAMEPNVQIGDFVFVDYFPDKTRLKRADIIIHEGEKLHKGKKLIKRIVAIPGDRVQLMNADIKGPDNKTFSVMRIQLNGKLVPLEFNPLGAKKYKLQKHEIEGNNSVFIETQGIIKYEILEEPRSGFFNQESPYEDKGPEITLGPDEYFVLGDNRDHSADSRHDGPIKLSQIVGKYVHTYFSFYIPDARCEMNPSLVFLWRYLTAPKTAPCGSAEIRWEKAGYTAH